MKLKKHWTLLVIESQICYFMSDMLTIYSIFGDVFFCLKMVNGLVALSSIVRSLYRLLNIKQYQHFCFNPSMDGLV